MSTRWTLCIAACVGLFVAVGPLAARDPGELFPDVGFEGESESDGSKTTDSAPPPPVRVEETVVIVRPKTPPRPTPTPTPEPTPAPNAPTPPPATPTPAVTLPWFLTTADAALTLEKAAKDPKTGADAAKAWAKTSKAPAGEKDLVLGIAELAAGNGTAARPRFARLAADPSPTLARAAAAYAALAAKYPKGLYEDQSLAQPTAMEAASKALAADLVAKARELLANALKANPDSLPQYNAAGGMVVRAKGLLTQADYLAPSADNEALAREILACEIALRRKGIDLILQRADKRKEVIDSIAGPMVYYQLVGNVTNSWGPIPNAQEINRYVDAMLRDKKRADVLLTQLKTLLEKAKITEDLADLSKRVAEADCVTVPKGTKIDDKWFNLGRMFGAINPNAKSPGSGFSETKSDQVVQVKPIRVRPPR